MKDTIITILKTLIGFIVFWIVLYLVFFVFFEIGTTSYDKYRTNNWEMALYFLIRTFKNIRLLSYLILIVLIPVIPIFSFLKNKFGKTKFDYNSEYQKFKSKNKVKITFMDGKEEVTKKVHIISIDAKEISFEDKEVVYKCVAAEIKNIQKSQNMRALIVVFEILLLLSLMSYTIILIEEPDTPQVEEYPDPVYITE